MEKSTKLIDDVNKMGLAKGQVQQQQYQPALLPFLTIFSD